MTHLVVRGVVARTSDATPTTGPRGLLQFQVLQKRRRCENALLLDRALVGTVHGRRSTHGPCHGPDGTGPSSPTKAASARAAHVATAPDSLPPCGDARVRNAENICESSTA